MTFAALDLHQRCITISALADTGEVLGERRRLPVASDQIFALRGELTTPATIAMESMLYCR